MIRIRQLNQDKTHGKIYLHSMPGRYEEFSDFKQEIKKLKLYKIICLTDKTEVKEKSPEYFGCVAAGKIGNIKIDYNPVPDYGIPEEEKDVEEYKSNVVQTYETLKAGNILIHCAGGIGRTGTFAVIILRMYGYTFEEALKIVQEAGSNPETQVQMDFCKNYKSKIRILTKKSCYNCQHGIPVPNYRDECSLMVDGKWVYEGGYCPKELICDQWVLDDYHGWEDKRERWRNATIIEVE